jgi:hypothetical protein
MEILNDLRLKLWKPIKALGPEAALVDAILNENRRLYELIAPEIVGLNRSSTVGPLDSRTVEQVARAALYALKEI